MKKIWSVVGAGAAMAALLSGHRVQPVTAQEAAAQPAYYTEKVLPILQQSCSQCHLNGNARGGLSLATKADTFRGGNSGVILIPGDAANSVLVKVVRREAGHPAMPPGRPLGEDEVAVIAKWVQAGAIMPADSPMAMGGGARGNGPGGPGGPGGGGGGGRPQTMDLAAAKKMLATIEAAAAQKGQHIAICVMDTNGEIVAFERMNTTDHIPSGTAEGKARAVLLFGVPTAIISDAQRNKKPLTAVVTSPPLGFSGGSGLTFLAGGLPIMKDGKMIGSIGVGGSASEEDEKFAELGIEAAGLTSK